MQGEVSRPVVIGTIIVIVLLIAVIGWSMFVPKQQTKADEDAYFAAHPEARAAHDNMGKMHANPVPPPGAVHGYPRRP